MKKLISLSTALITVFFLTTSNAAQARDTRTLEIKIPVSVLTNKIKTAFKGTKIHLSNYGKKHGHSWYKGNSSYIKFPSSLNKSKYRFSIPPENRFPFRYYVNDINLKSYGVGTSSNRFLLRFNFEDNGTEIKGRCSSKNWAKSSICRLRGSDKAAPDIHMRNMTASVYLTPSVRNGSISFGKVSTNFTANIRVGKTCNKLKKIKLGGLCKSIEKKIKKSVKTAMKKMNGLLVMRFISAWGNQLKNVVNPIAPFLK